MGKQFEKSKKKGSAMQFEFKLEEKHELKNKMNNELDISFLWRWREFGYWPLILKQN